jgi:flagellar motor switch protein FliN
MADEQNNLNNEELNEQPAIPPDSPDIDGQSGGEAAETAGDNLAMPDMDFDKSAKQEESAEPAENKDFDKVVNPNDIDEADAEAAMLKMMEEEAAAPLNKVVNPGDTNEDDAEAEMLRMMEESEQAGGVERPTVEKMGFGNLTPSKQTEPRNLNMLMDVSLPISIELGRTTMAIEDILNLGPGSVVELDKLAGEPVDLLVNNKLMAKGEVVVIDENFGVRITTMVSKSERIRSLK